ncbi:hypothetical protein NPIL_163911 [Nephila pilipes]|uniref:Uncharacterized protein n=1 Tax=Nephila pilipes TaxID=299642 RepID=A0A8X6NMD6_NEPPI|nr:hypothetical protein NPIL_163911 [Nephila pilipes]
MLSDNLEVLYKILPSLPCGSKRHVKASETLNIGNQVNSRKPEHLSKTEHSHVVPGERSHFKCYGCEIPGMIKSRCLPATPAPHEEQSFADLVLDVKNVCWYFWDNSTHKYPAGEELVTLSISEKMYSNTCQLREREGVSLTSVQKKKLNILLLPYEIIFETVGEETSVLEQQDNRKFYTKKKREKLSQNISLENMSLWHHIH